MFDWVLNTPPYITTFNDLIYSLYEEHQKDYRKQQFSMNCFFQTLNGNAISERMTKRKLSNYSHLSLFVHLIFIVCL